MAFLALDMGGLGRSQLCCLGGNLFGAHAIFDHADAFDLAADDIARLQESLRLHEEGDTGR